MECCIEDPKLVMITNRMTDTHDIGQQTSKAKYNSEKI